MYTAVHANLIAEHCWLTIFCPEFCQLIWASTAFVGLNIVTGNLEHMPSLCVQEYIYGYTLSCCPIFVIASFCIFRIFLFPCQYFYIHLNSGVSFYLAMVEFLIVLWAIEMANGPATTQAALTKPASKMKLIALPQNRSIPYGP
jgi:hypothetical protein